jgi:hypothetical protein
VSDIYDILDSVQFPESHRVAKLADDYIDRYKRIGYLRELGSLYIAGFSEGWRHALATIIVEAEVATGKLLRLPDGSLIEAERATAEQRRAAATLKAEPEAAA